MSTESLDRNFITQQLADMAADIKRTALETKGQKLSSAMALGQALLKVGRTHLTESLRLMSEASVAASIDYYINNMPPLQAEQFKIGLSFGILGSTIAAIEDPKQYLTYFNNYITGTPLPSEPTKLYKQAEVISQSRGMIEPEKESQRLRELVTKDPSLSSILSNIESLPTTVRIHFLSLHPSVGFNVQNIAIPMYWAALATLDRISIPALPTSQDQLTGTFLTQDRDWLETLGSSLDSL